MEGMKSWLLAIIGGLSVPVSYALSFVRYRSLWLLSELRRYGWPIPAAIKKWGDLAWLCRVMQPAGVFAGNVALGAQPDRGQSCAMRRETGIELATSGFGHEQQATACSTACPKRDI